MVLPGHQLSEDTSPAVRLAQYHTQLPDARCLHHSICAHRCHYWCLVGEEVAREGIQVLHYSGNLHICNSSLVVMGRKNEHFSKIS